MLQKDASLLLISRLGKRTYTAISFICYVTSSRVLHTTRNLFVGTEVAGVCNISVVNLAL